jgi:hypothetical protein
MAKIHYSTKAPATPINTYRGARTQEEPFCGSTSMRTRTWWITSDKTQVTCAKCLADGKMENMDRFFTELDESFAKREARKAAAAADDKMSAVTAARAKVAAAQAALDAAIAELATAEIEAGLIRRFDEAA